MGRINLKSEKSSVKKYRTTLVRTSFPDDFYSLYLSGRIIASGTFEVVSSIRELLEHPLEPVQLELFDYGD